MPKIRVGIRARRRVRQVRRRDRKWIRSGKIAKPWDGFHGRGQRGLEIFKGRIARDRGRNPYAKGFKGFAKNPGKGGLGIGKKVSQPWKFF